MFFSTFARFFLSFYLSMFRSCKNRRWKEFRSLDSFVSFVKKKRFFATSSRHAPLSCTSRDEASARRASSLRWIFAGALRLLKDILFGGQGDSFVFFVGFFLFCSCLCEKPTILKTFGTFLDCFSVCGCILKRSKNNRIRNDRKYNMFDIYFLMNVVLLCFITEDINYCLQLIFITSLTKHMLFWQLFLNSSLIVHGWIMMQNLSDIRNKLKFFQLFLPPPLKKHFFYTKPRRCVADAVDQELPPFSWNC